MQCDQVIWDTINGQFCSYKLKTTTQTFCRNEYNLTGLCSRQSCPLANSRYATIKEIDGTLFLFVKTIERAHSPAKLWQKIKLSKSYAKALEQIDSELLYFPKFMIHKCKQRLTKITQYLIRMRRIKLKTKPKLIGVSRKVEKIQRKKEVKAEAAAKLNQSIEKELLDRLRKGVYGSDGIINESEKAFADALDKIEDMEDMEVEYDDDEDEEEVEEDLLDREFVSDVSESEDDMEDFDQEHDDEIQTGDGFSSSESDSSDDDDDSDEIPDKKKAVKKRKPKKAFVEVEYEHEQEAPAQETW